MTAVSLLALDLDDTTAEGVDRGVAVAVAATQLPGDDDGPIRVRGKVDLCVGERFGDDVHLTSSLLGKRKPRVPANVCASRRRSRQSVLL